MRAVHVFSFLFLLKTSFILGLKSIVGDLNFNKTAEFSGVMPPTATGVSFSTPQTLVQLVEGGVSALLRISLMSLRSELLVLS